MRLSLCTLVTLVAVLALVAEVLGFNRDEMKAAKYAVKNHLGRDYKVATIESISSEVGGTMYFIHVMVKQKKSRWSRVREKKECWFEVWKQDRGGHTILRADCDGPMPRYFGGAPSNEIPHAH